MRFLRFLPVICFLFLSGCARETTAPSTPSAPLAQKTQKFPRDDLGREVNLLKPAQRVVCIGPGATETIFALGAGGQLVGRDQVSDYPKAALKVPIAGDYNGPFIEKVIALRPDLIIVQGETYDKARAELWQKKIGAPVAILVPASVAKVAWGIEKIGAWLGLRNAAVKVAKPLVDRVKEVARSEKETKSMHGKLYPFVLPAFFEVQRSPLWTAGRGTLIDDIMRLSGFSNVAADTNGYKQFGFETLLARKPDIYIATIAEDKFGEYSVPEMKVLKAIRQDRRLSKLPCIKMGCVVLAPSNLTLRPGPRLAQGISCMVMQKQMVTELGYPSNPHPQRY